MFSAGERRRSSPTDEHPSKILNDLRLLRRYVEIAKGDGPQRSAFLSAFFTLVGCHGGHVSAGILWLLTMMAQVFAKGFRADIQRRFLCFALFWHALDIIWVAVFSVVYLLGSGV